MLHIRDTCIEFFKNEDTRKNVKEMLKPVTNIIYNEMYYYIWFICIYNVLLLFIIIVNLVLLIKLLNFTPISPITMISN